MEFFSNKNIDYCMTMKEKNIQIITAKYAKNIVTTYKEECEPINTNTIVTTRSGRHIKRPIKLDL